MDFGKIGNTAFVIIRFRYAALRLKSLRYVL
jgi:hypothetical protein